MSDVVDTATEVTTEAAPVEASHEPPSRLSPAVRAMLAKAASESKPEPIEPIEEAAHESTDSEPEASAQAAGDTPATEQAGAPEAGESAPAPGSEVEQAWQHIDAATAKLEARAKELDKATRELEGYRARKEQLLDDPAKAIRGLVRDLLDIDDDNEAERQYMELLTELNVDAGGDLVPVERRYESLKKRSERERLARERRAKLEATRQADDEAKAAERANSSKALDVIRAGVDLDKFPHLGLEDEWEAKVYAAANDRYQRTNVVPPLPVIAAELEAKAKEKFAARVARFVKPAQPSTPPAKASTQTAAPSKPAPRTEAKASAVDREDPNEPWSYDGSRAKLLDKFARSMR